jgi:hypothetical protein
MSIINMMATLIGRISGHQKTPHAGPCCVSSGYRPAMYLKRRQNFLQARAAKSIKPYTVNQKADLHPMLAV